MLSGDVGCGQTVLRNVRRDAGCARRRPAHTGPRHLRTFAAAATSRASVRITEAFIQAKTRAAIVGRGILIIDEADDLATGRSQIQAHHEDRAGVNVLIKQIDQLAANPVPIALIMITNRADALDPAAFRRAALRLTFQRPDEQARFAVFERILRGTSATAAEIRELAKRTVPSDFPNSYGHLTDRIARLALRRAWKGDQRFGIESLKAAIAQVAPSPLMSSQLG